MLHLRNKSNILTEITIANKAKMKYWLKMNH